MPLSFLLVFTGSIIAAEHPPSTNDSAEHRRAIAVIEKLGGQVTVRGDGSNESVTVTLTGAGDPLGCLPYLRDVRNLATCDL